MKRPSIGRPLTRSEMMARIRGRDTSPEKIVRSGLHLMGLRFRVCYPTPGGKVDIAFPKEKLAIQIDGCFWHNCPIHSTKPKTNKNFWYAKLMANKKRDKRQNKTLAQSGWTVYRIWEHEIEDDPNKTILKAHAIVKKNKSISAKIKAGKRKV